MRSGHRPPALDPGTILETQTGIGFPPLGYDLSGIFGTRCRTNSARTGCITSTRVNMATVRRTSYSTRRVQLLFILGSSFSYDQTRQVRWILVRDIFAVDTRFAGQRVGGVPDPRISGGYFYPFNKDVAVGGVTSEVGYHAVIRRLPALS